jgi:hypothetical protein
MSVITSGSRMPVVRRITPSGEVYFGEVLAGRTQPFTHVVVVPPLRGGGDAGLGGGVTTVGDGEALAAATTGEPEDAATSDP